MLKVTFLYFNTQTNKKHINMLFNTFYEYSNDAYKA